MADLTVSHAVAYEVVRRPAHIREGQAAFNALFELRQDLSEQIRTTDLDPFYRDDRLPAFWAWLEGFDV